jgi:RND family efflux transporter MFP subunit
MKRFVALFVAAGAIAVLSFLAGSMSRHPAPRHPGADGVTVDVATIRPASDPSVSDYALSGRVRAAREVTLTAQVPARLTALPVREGEPFRAGQALMIFDSPETRQAVRSAEAAVAASAVHRDEAIRELARIDSLSRRGLVAQRQLELARSAREAAEAGWLGATAELASWRQNTALSVPFDGVVIRRHVDTGALLFPGQAVLDVRSHGGGEIDVAVPESQVSRLSAGSALVQTLGATTWIPARIVRVDGMVDVTSRTRMAHLEVTTGAGLEPGSSVRVRLAGDEPGTTRLSVPAASLVRRGSLNGVYVVKDGRAWLRWLRVGRSVGERVEVLAGLEPTDEVVAGPAGLADGAPVRVER